MKQKNTKFRISYSLIYSLLSTFLHINFKQLQLVKDQYFPAVDF
jgi:hypothetical protein